MVRKLKEEYAKAGLDIDFGKTKHVNIEIIQNLETDEKITTRGTDEFKYLRSIICKC